VVGLEVHAQLLTKSKLFCGDSIEYGAPPNTQVSPITLGHPGTLPKMNRKAIEYAIKMGIACHCSIERHNYFVRKNYFYPDLPKGYQVSQHTTPICKGGYVSIMINNSEKHVRLNRIHLEEDAGKSLHASDHTNIDLNRAGTALIEIVTEPDLGSGDEAFAYLSEVRKLVRYLDICDGNMEQGSLRCDANISVRVKGDPNLGTKVEVKNLNSMRNVKRAIEFESKRLIGLLESNDKIQQETRSFDPSGGGTTFSIRVKEDADDYRYFPEPDLTPFFLDDQFINEVSKTIPALQQERIKKYTSEWGLSVYDAEVLTEDKNFSGYFERIIALFNQNPRDSKRYKAAANWMLGPVKSWMNDTNEEITEFPLGPDKLGALIDLVIQDKLSFSSASTRVFPALLKDPGGHPEQIAVEQNLIQQSDSSELEPLVDQVLIELADKVTEYKKGKKGLLSLFVGEVMKKSKGKADPKITNKLLLEKLKS
jgi:aspartyl-tRNA(Asn)/glutamyl-tRNA(Gln) amidotransferase subunit B